MSLYCFSNFSAFPIHIHFFNEDREDERFLPYDLDFIRNYATEYEILSIVVEYDYIFLTLYNPSEFTPK